MIFSTFNNKSQLANFLKLSIKQLDFIAHCKKAQRYKHLHIPKKDGGVRDLYVPNSMLKEIQKKILLEMQKVYKPRGCAFAYIQGRNIKDHAQKHIDKKWVLRVDLKDYFPSINFGRIRGIFKYLGCCEEIATYLAQLCCHEGKLPQGACTSPILSNLIASKMDSQLSKIAKENFCFYTRYCDDIYFSTNRKIFPQNIAFFDNTSGNKFCQVGNDLKKIINNNDFVINEGKVYLSDKSNRQFVTGLVVNEKVNVNRNFIRNIRPIIKRLKLNSNFKEEYFAKNQKNILAQLRGKIEYIGYIKGYDDLVYRKYALELSTIDPNYKFNRRNLSFGDGKVVEIYCEGETDYIHLKSILNHFKTQGLYTELEVRFGDYSEISSGQDGCLNLLKASVQKNMENSYLTIYIFDADDVKTLSNLKLYENKLKCQKIMVLPKPVHYDVNEYCIEHMYSFKDILKVKDNENRRIYLKSEFDDIGFHKTENIIYMKKTKTLVVDSEIFDIETKKNIALSKKSFSNIITSEFLDNVDLTNFKTIFDQITDLKMKFYS